MSFPGLPCGIVTLGLLVASILVLLVSLGVAIHLYCEWPFLYCRGALLLSAVSLGWSLLWRSRAWWGLA